MNDFKDLGVIPSGCQFDGGRLQSAIFDQCLAVSQKLCNVGI